MTPLVLITGPFRSGTSAVAQVVHRMGFPVAAQITPPQPPKWMSDWEDQFALIALQQILNSKDPPKFFLQWFPAYLNCRREHATKMAHLTNWTPLGFAMKSPLYAPFIDQIRDVCAEIDKPLLVIKCQREKSARDKSHDADNAKITMYPDMMAAVRRAAKLAEDACEDVKEDLLVDYELLVHNPQAECQRIADFLKCPASDAWTVIQSRGTENLGCPSLSSLESPQPLEQGCPTPSPVPATVP